MATRTFQRESLIPSPQWEGVELASPGRRVGALAVDVLLLFVPNALVTLVILALALLLRYPLAFRALVDLALGHAETREAKAHALGHVAPVLVALGARGLPAEVAKAVGEGKLDEAGAILADARIAFEVSTAGSPASGRTGSSSVISVPVLGLVPKPLHGIVLYAVAAIYFAVSHRSRGSATLGQRLVGIRVVRVDGRRLSFFQALERFVGYFQVAGTFGLGFLDLWRDPNRCLAHDRLAGTIVIRTRRTTGPGRPSSVPRSSARSKSTRTKAGNRPWAP